MARRRHGERAIRPPVEITHLCEPTLKAGRITGPPTRRDLSTASGKSGAGSTLAPRLPTPIRVTLGRYSGVDMKVCKVAAVCSLAWLGLSSAGAERAEAFGWYHSNDPVRRPLLSRTGLGLHGSLLHLATLPRRWLRQALLRSVTPVTCMAGSNETAEVTSGISASRR